LKINPLKVKLDKEEKQILRDFERGEFRRVPNMAKEVKRYQAYARASMKKNKRVNIRLAESDIKSIQHLAVEEGIPYQTLMASILHKYAAGRLVTARV